MRKLTLLWVILLTPLTLYGQTSVAGRTITLPTGQVSLKIIFASISNQTGYIFSYDARKINDKESLFIGKDNVFTLQSSLSAILSPDVKYKMIGKYIVLYKKSSNAIADEKPLLPQKIPDISETKFLVTDSIFPIINVGLKDTVNAKRIEISLNSGSKEINIDRRLLSVETTYNSHLTHLSLLLGEKTFFGKASICYDYHESYHLGLGVGMNIHLTPVLGLSVDISQYTLVFGKTKKMDVNTYTTELNPLVTYTLNNRFKVKAGPSFYRIQSNLSTKNENIDLGRYLGCNAVIGLQIKLL